jgi:hypothetical protein
MAVAPSANSSNPTPAPAETAIAVAPAASVVTPSVVAPTPSVPRDSLAQEVLLLSRATSALRAGHAGEALKALGEYQRKFPSGALTEERRAAKAQALCISKRVSEGRTELAHLAPGSPAAARARQVCDSIAAAGEKP